METKAFKIYVIEGKTKIYKGVHQLIGAPVVNSEVALAFEGDKTINFKIVEVAIKKPLTKLVLRRDNEDKKGEGESKYLPSFDREKATKLLHILEPLMKGSLSLMGVAHTLEDLLQRPSYFRKCDVLLSKEIFEAIKRVQ